MTDHYTAWWDGFRSRKWFERRYIGCGAHNEPGRGRCAMEWIAAITGEFQTDHPSCVDSDLRELIVTYNDTATAAQRQKLRPLLIRMIGTFGDGQGRARSVVFARTEMRPRNRYTAEEWDAILETLDKILPETVDLPPGVAERALEFCGGPNG